jgi:hypothetical protein
LTSTSKTLAAILGARYGRLDGPCSAFCVLGSIGGIFRNLFFSVSKTKSRFVFAHHIRVEIDRHLAAANTTAAKAASLEPWFPSHLQRNVYLSLLHLESEAGEKKTPQVPESVLKAALLRRATEDIHRILAVRSSKQALSTLLQRGSVGDDLWQRLLRAEKEIEEELRDVVNEVYF